MQASFIVYPITKRSLSYKQKKFITGRKKVYNRGIRSWERGNEEEIERVCGESMVKDCPSPSKPHEMGVVEGEGKNVV